jgi:spermidine/putrescine transport system permease protein
MRWKHAIGNALSGFYLTACYVFILLPVAVLILFSFQDGRLAVPPFKGPTLDWYVTAFKNDRMMDGLIQSLFVGITSSAISVVLGFLAAYGISRHEFPARRLLQGVIILPLAVSYLLVGMGLLMTLSALGFGPSLWVVVIGHVVINMPLAFAICLAQLGEHQRKIEWAARDLGASTFRVLTQVTMPMIAPALVAAFCLCFTLSWDEFIIAYLVTRFDVTLPIVIWTMLRGGLNPQTNAVGSFIFLCSVLMLVAVELLLFRKRRA